MQYGPQYNVNAFNNSGRLGASNPTAGDGAGNPLQGRGSSADIGDFLARLFGGDPSKPYQDAQNTYNQYAQKVFGYLDPYNQAGQKGLGNWQAMLQKMSDPQAFVNNILSGYKMSPAAQMQLQQGQNAISNAASASGMLGSSAFGGNMAQYAEGLTANDMQNYLNNILGVNRDVLGGYRDISGMGLQAGGQEANYANQQAAANANLAYDQSQAGLANQQGMWGDVGDFISNFIPTKFKF